MFGTAVRLDQQRVLQFHFLGDTTDHTGLAVADILGHTAVVRILEAKNIVGLAHPVSAALAESASTAGNDLVRRNTVSDLVFRHILAFFHDRTEEFMSRDKRRFYIGRLYRVAPEHRRAVSAFQVTCADAAALGFDNDVIRTAFRRRVLFFQPVIRL